MNQSTPSVAIYEHVKRPEWGSAVVAWEQDSRRGYLFEDGTMRVIAEPFYAQFEAKEAGQQPLSPAFQRHIREAHVANAAKTATRSPNTDANFTLAEQAQLFLEEYPGGFSATPWVSHHRHAAGPKPLKRHRDALVEEAQTLLSKERIQAAIDNHEHGDFWKRVAAMLSQTDIVALKEAKALAGKASSARAELTAALAAVLYLSEPTTFDAHFAKYVSELQRLVPSAGSWSLTTALLALCAPDKHLCVHMSSLRLQGRWLREKSIVAAKPNGADYTRALELARSVASRLGESGLHATDLLDIHDFMKETTAPAARRRLIVMRDSPLPVQESTAVDGDAGALDPEASPSTTDTSNNSTATEAGRDETGKEQVAA